MIDTELLDSLEPIIESVASEFGRRHRVHGADQQDFAQELRLWIIDNAEKVAEWYDRDLYSERDSTNLLAKALRNESKDYALDIRAQAVGYERQDLYFYGKGEVKALLPAMFDPDKWHEPPQSEGRTTKAPSEGGNWIATLTDVSQAYSKLKQADQHLLRGFHLSGWTNKMMADAEGVSESLMSYYHDRALGRLVNQLGGGSPRPMRPQEGRDPWRGRHAVSNAGAIAYQTNVYEG